MSIEQRFERVEKQIIKSNHPFYEMLDRFCYLSKNLYNHALWEIKNAWETEKKSINYYALASILPQDTEFPDYRNMPTAQSAQQTLKKVAEIYKAYFKTFKDWQKNPGKYQGMPKPPKFLPKESGRFVLTLTNQEAKLKDDGYIHFPKTFNGFTIKPAFTSKSNVQSFQQVRFIPRNAHIVAELIYKVETVDIKEDNGRYLGIDMGIDNLACVINNFGETPFTIDGHSLKSINQFWNKQNAKYRELAIERNGKHSTSRLLNMTDKRNNRVDDFLHKASKYIVDFAIKHDVSIIVIGKNDGWKQESDIGKRNNQNFTQIPHARLISMITYKANQVGIAVIEQEESYTSKASFLDMDVIPTWKKDDTETKYTFSGKRTHRGLYVSSNGIEMNADVNGAYNILRKCKPNAFAKGVEGVGLHPVRVTVD